MPSERIFNPSRKASRGTALRDSASLKRRHRQECRRGGDLGADYNPAALVRFTRNQSLRRW